MTFEEADKLYPYDPKARVEFLRGVEKLRGFADPAMRRNVFLALSGELNRPPKQPAQQRIPWDQRPPFGAHGGKP